VKRGPIYALGTLLPFLLFLPLIPYLPVLMPYVREVLRRVVETP
jgi:hypothetical protein